MSQIVLNSVTGLIQFNAIDELDNFSPLTGLTSFTVYYSLNAGAATAMTTPTVTEISAANMPGMYFLAVDEAGMVSAIGDLGIHIVSTGMISVRKQVDIVNSAGGGGSDPWLTILPGSYGEGTAGKIIGSNIQASLNTIKGLIL